jgi:hypothetical protein
MRPAAAVFAAVAAIMAATAIAGEGEPGGPPTSPDAKPAWAFAVTAYPTDVRGGDNYTSAIAAADRGPLHLEARANYESVGARSAFIGWAFSGGDAVKWQLRPLLGGVWGTTQAYAPALEASVAWQRFDVYIEAEFVRDRNTQADSYAYAWTELGFRPVEWLRVGIAGQRTRVYSEERDIQRGPFAQFTWGRVTLGGFWFNPGAQDQIFVGSIGATF